MQALLLFLVDNKNWIYIILVIALILYAHRLSSALSEWRSTIFGLERESAQRRLNSSLAMVILLTLMMVAEFLIVNFVIPEWPQVMITPSVMGEETMMVTRPAEAAGTPEVNVVTAMPEPGEITLTDVDGNPLPINTDQAAASTVNNSGCISGEIEWISPNSGEEISGIFELIATVNIQNLGFFNYEYSPIADQQNWTAISAGSLPVIEGPLGVWSTDQVENGDYVLRLTVLDMMNNAFPPCDVPIRVTN